MHKEILDQIKNTNDKESLDKLKVHAFGKNGLISTLMREISYMSLDEKKDRGSKINMFKDELKKTFSDRIADLENEKWKKKLESELVDTSLPCKDKMGRFHPLMQAMDEIIETFNTLGFSVKNGSEIETSFFNFTALRVPEHHPSRSEQDTFYLSDDILLRTHTTSVQVKALKEKTPPVRIVSPGRVYRPDDLDKTHAPMFHQIEVLAVDKGIDMGHLKWIMEEFLRIFFERKVEIRFRSSFFPFTEPSAEIDVLFGNEWLEVLGCGMIHPEILKSCVVDTSKYSGFAAGSGIERLAMLKYGISDLRPFFANDQRWLLHHGFFVGK